jgi:acyl dehydratase
MLKVKTPQDLSAHLGTRLGTSDWILVDQAMINAFAAATGDCNWYHVDVERAAQEMPGGRTIAHGFLTLSLIAKLSSTIYEVTERKRGVNYGIDKVRFLSPVMAGSRVRLHQTLSGADPIPNGMRLTFACEMELEGASKPAMIAETIILIF